jgi:hypothetical protein
MTIATILWAGIGSLLLLYLIVFLVRNWDMLPVALLPLIWYLPEQTSRGRLLVDFIFARWLTVILIPLIILILLARRAREPRPFYTTRIFFPILFFSIFTFASGLINKTPMFDIVGYLIIYIRYPLFFMFLADIDIPYKTIKTFVIMFLVLIYIQIPEVLFRYLALGIKGDEVSWTLGAWGTTNIGIYSMYAMCIILAHGLLKGLRIKHFLGISLFFIPALLGEIKALILITPVLALFVIFFTPFRTRTLKYATLLISVFIIASTSFLVYRNWDLIHKSKGIDSFIQSVYNVANAETTEEERYKVNRLGTFLEIYNAVSMNPTNLIWGFGPGSSLTGGFSKRSGRVITEFISEGSPLNQYGATIGDVGIIGLLLYLWILISVWRMIPRAGPVVNPTLYDILHVAFPGLWFFYTILSPFYHTVWRYDASSYIFYFVVAVLFQKFVLHKNDETAVPMPKAIR